MILTRWARRIATATTQYQTGHLNPSARPNALRPGTISPTGNHRGRRVTAPGEDNNPGLLQEHAPSFSTPPVPSFRLKLAPDSHLNPLFIGA